MPVDERSLEELEAWSAVLAGQVVDGESGLVPVDVGTIRRTWDAVTSKE